MKINYLDIDELNDRLSELETLRDAVVDAEDALKEAQTDEDKESAQDELDNAQAEFGEDERKELEALEDFKNEVGESKGKISEDGGPFIDERDFEEYAREFADEIGAIESNASWPNTCIDWEKAASELQMDYSSVEYQGVTYLYRS